MYKNDINYHLFAALGYFFLLIINIKGLTNNFNKKVTYIIGSFILICGFSIGIIEKIYNSRGENLLNSDKINFFTDTVTNNIGLRHILLFSFHILNCYFPMNEGKLTLDMAAVLGHSLLMFNVENKIGNCSMFIFYVLSVIYNLKKINNFEIYNTIPLLGNSLLSMFFLFEINYLLKIQLNHQDVLGDIETGQIRRIRHGSDPLPIDDQTEDPATSIGAPNL